MTCITIALAEGGTACLDTGDPQRLKKRIEESGFSGEALIRHLARSNDGLLDSVLRYNRESLINNGANGEPAGQYFTASGTLAEVIYARDGRFQNTEDGLPADIMINKKGQVFWAVSYDDKGKGIGGVDSSELPAIEEKLRERMRRAELLDEAAAELRAVATPKTAQVPAPAALQVSASPSPKGKILA